MAMSASNLSAVMRAAIVAYPWANDGPELTQLCDAIAEAVVAEVQNATLTFNATNTTSLGVSTAPPGTPIGPPASPAVVNGAVS